MPARRYADWYASASGLGIVAPWMQTRVHHARAAERVQNIRQLRDELGLGRRWCRWEPVGVTREILYRQEGKGKK